MRARDVMTPDPVRCSSGTTIREAAGLMRDNDIGDVLVEDDGRLCGIVTDRDIVIRGLAEDRDPTSVTLGEVCSADVATVDADTEVDDIIRLMQDQALRRVPVVEGARAVGIVSIGDLAVERDRDSALGRISAAPPDQ